MKTWQWDIVTHTCNPSTQEADAEGAQVWGQFGVLLRPFQKKKKKRGNSEAHLADHVRLSASSEVVLESLLKGSQHDLDGQDHRRACRKRILFWELFWLS